MRVLAITRGSPPLEDIVTVGSAIRAYNYLSYLQRFGFECFYVSKEEELKDIAKEVNGIRMIPFSSDYEIRKIIDSLQPDFVIVCVSELLHFLPEDNNAIVILDLFAHRVLESIFEDVDFSIDLFLRLDSLRKVDYFVVSSARQRDFVSSLLILAGLTDVLDRVLVIPQIILNCPLQRKIPEEVVFVAGGYNWPWADDKAYINRLVEILEKKGKGELRIFGGKFAIESRAYGSGFNYRKSDRIRYMGTFPYGRLLAEYSCASVGILCFERNIERFYSYNFRGSDYLFSGLPVIVNDYMQMSELIRKYDAGWVIRGISDFEEVVDRIISDNELIVHKSDNVATLIMQEFDVVKCMEPLVNILKKPSKLEKREGLIWGLVRIVDRYVKEGIEHANLIKEVKELQAENIRLSERIVSKDNEILRLNNEKTELMRECGWLKDECKRLNDELFRFKDEIIKLKNDRDRLSLEVSELNAKLTELMRKNGFLEDEKVRTLNEISFKSDEIIRLKNEVVELRKTISMLELETQKRDEIITVLRKKEAELEGIKSLPLYKFYKKVF
ncbi:MAG: hypothetical protein N2746_00515 [Deltaproteobacteria bacterium]|nr:hypothetical protein [Deltaproteobacteria bacterium]